MRAEPKTRREFLSDVGHGMLIASLGYAAAENLGLGTVWAEEASPERISFGAYERLASLMQETAPDDLLHKLVDLHRTGTSLKDLIAAAALANTRAFGGEDYVGFHAFMAMSPALTMAMELPPERRLLPILEVIYRSSKRLHERGSHDVLRPLVDGASLESTDAAAIQRAVDRKDHTLAEHALVLAGRDTPDRAWNVLLPTVQGAPEVHRIVLAHRAWDMAQLVGEEQAVTLLRQSLHYCIRHRDVAAKYYAAFPSLLGRLLDDHDLGERPLGSRTAEDEWVRDLSETLFKATPEQGAEAVAAALGEGFSPDAVSDAIALAANELVLRDAGRSSEIAGPGKGAGSVHGDSIGVHSSDAANAWRHIARSSNPRNAAASLIASGYHVVRDRLNGASRFDEWQPRPFPEHTERVKDKDPARLLAELESAIRDQDQERACALAGRYTDLGHCERPIFDVLLKYAVSEDGALHAEKYYFTARDEFARARPAFRNRQLIALARVTASEYGTPAPGYKEACEILGLSAG